MLHIADVAGLAAVFDLEAAGDTLIVEDGYTAQPLSLERLRASHITLSQVTVDGSLTFRSCRLDSLVLDHCAADDLMLFDCIIERFEIRNGASLPTVAVIEGGYRVIHLNGVRATRVQRTTVSSRFQLSGLRGSLLAANTRFGELSVEGQLPDRGQHDIHIAHCSLSTHLAISDVALDELLVSDTDVRGRVDLSRLTIRTNASFQRIRVERSFTMGGMKAEKPVVFRQCRLLQGLESSRMSQVGPSRQAATVMTIHGSVITGDLYATVTEPGATLLLDNTHVQGRIQLPAETVLYQLKGDSNVENIELPGAAVRSYAQAKRLAAVIFSEVDNLSYAMLRSAFGRQSRPSEEDLFYFLQREEKAGRLTGVRGAVTRSVFGRVLGWGVRISAPARALGLSVALTAVALEIRDLAMSHNPVSSSGVGRNAALALALWLNVQTGIPSGLTGAGWTLVADVAAGLGVFFTTVLVGIAIRKLVR